MQRLCTYVITQDTGLAPNPYWGYCTLAVCTPNHQSAKLNRGDWIAGFLSKKRDYRFLYAMEIAERMHMNDYFHDSRYATKKPNLLGSWKERCGDNFYCQVEDGSWKQHRNRFHIGENFLKRDTRQPFVFASSRFWYFGRNACRLPDRFMGLVGGRGVRMNHDESHVTAFLSWVETLQPGVQGLPNDNPDIPSDSA